jgi:hypothetical protein
MFGRGRSRFKIVIISVQTEENHEDLSEEGEIFRNTNLIITKPKGNSGIYTGCFRRKSQYFGIAEVSISKNVRKNVCPILND